MRLIGASGTETNIYRLDSNLATQTQLKYLRRSREITMYDPGYSRYPGRWSFPRKDGQTAHGFSTRRRT